MSGRAGPGWRRGRLGSAPAPAPGRRRLKPLRTVVAWRGRAEWDQVMVGLYCGDSRLQQDALDRVSAWKSRYGQKMPLAVDCTAELIRCKVLDSSGRLKSHELILSYGLALVRFVNLITERKQKMASIPLRQLAREVDIPIWVVDLRHELTHGKLPRLALCRKGCDVVLDWLRKTYWSRQLGNNLCEESEDEDEEEEEANTELGNDAWEIQTPQHEACQKHKEFHEKVRDILISYKNEQFRVMQTMQSASKSRELWSDSSSEMDWILAQIKDLMQENRESVAEALLSDGFLIPKMDCLKLLNIKYEANKEVWQFKIPQTFYCFWQPLLTGLLSRSFTQILIEKMFMELKECSDSSELRHQFLISWISELLTGIAKVNAGKKRQHCNKQVSVKELFLHKVPLQWIRLTDSCLEAPCWATPHLLQLILTVMRPRLSRTSRKNLLYLASIYTEGGAPLSSPGLSSDSSEHPIYTIESLQWRVRQENQVKNQGQTVEKEDDVLERDDGVEEAEEEEEEMVTETNPLEGLAHPGNMAAVAERRAALQGSAWQITADEVQWKDFPLGKLPGQTDDPDGLMLDNYSMMSLLDQPVRDEWKTLHTNSAELKIHGTGGLLWTQNDFHKIKSGLQLF
ncbi:PREDICTED: ribosomal biogenesis protein LAS1L [Lepidothrix coronata]|uniref:Ribosomal biogenesis protein LAS1L n=1 Tax=Lepidothrix coronata TaxID=321398 RepID=A0A6J0J4K6_9PASS|nr:PREDICTED: ribosomal biogenesis protein LAS1L [Lepidothrix coronata]